MSTTILAVTIISHIILPFMLILWVGFSRAKSRFYWVMVVLLVAACMVIMHFVGAAWAWVSRYWIFVFWALLVLAIGRFSGRRWPLLEKWPKGVWGWTSSVVVLLMAGYLMTAFPSIVQARFAEEEPVALSWPIRGGTFFVGHGGSNEIVNHHHRVRAQQYGLDVLALNLWGMRAKGFLPEELEAYEIWDAVLISPCSGEVLSAANDREDQPPMEMGSENIMGNYITIFCEDVTVVMAHMKEGSVLVEEGDEVQRGQGVGRVGNSGNTTEPHLHIHAVKGRVIDERELLAEGEGVAMEFEGRFLVRNQVISIR